MADPLSAERLRTLAAVRRHGTLAAAAVHLHLSPSAVSQQLGKLEREAGTRLLVPDGRGVRLTAAGEALADRADRIAAELLAARRDLDALDGAVTGPVRVGAIPSAVHTFLTAALTALADEHPGIEPELVELEPEDGLPLLRSDRLDVQIVESWENLPLPRVPDTTWTPLLDDGACVVLPAGHRLAGDGPGDGTVDAADLADAAWVGWGTGTRAHAWMCHTLRERGIEPDVRHTVTGYSTQFAVVAGLHAAALVPGMATIVAPPSTVSLPLRPPLNRTVYAAHRTHHARPALLQCVRTVADAARTWRATAPAPATTPAGPPTSA